MTPFNNNRNSSNLCSSTFVVNPTIASLGTMLESCYIGNAEQGGPIQTGGGKNTADQKWILNPNYVYLLWFIADEAATPVSFDLGVEEVDLF